MINKWKRGLAVGLAIGAFSVAGIHESSVRGDVLIKTDGTRLQGRVVAQDSGSITFEANFEGLLVRQKVARAQIKELKQEVQHGVGYCVLPMTGVVGSGITAESLKVALGMARSDGAKYVILSFDSPGGSLGEMVKILNVMKDAKDLTLVAYVEKEAISAAAILAVGCPQIYMADGSAIGASVPFKVGPHGTPEDIEQKFQSAYRALIRGVAEANGHSPLFVRGMSETEIELVLRPGKSGNMLIAEADPGKELPKDKIIKEHGKILTLTANEAVESGLSVAKVEGIDQIRTGLGVSAWHKTGEGAAAYLQNHAKAESASQAPGHQVSARLDELTEKREELKKQMRNKEDAYNAEVAAVKAAYAKAINEGKPPSEAEKYQQDVKDRADNQLAEIAARYRPQMIDLDTQLRTITSEEAALRGLTGKLGE